MWMIYLSSGHLSSGHIAKTNGKHSTNISTTTIRKSSLPWRGKKTTGSAFWMLPWQERTEVSLMKFTGNPHTLHLPPPPHCEGRNSKMPGLESRDNLWLRKQRERAETPKKYFQTQWFPEGGHCTKPEENGTYHMWGRGSIQHRQAQTAVPTCTLP